MEGPYIMNDTILLVEDEEGLRNSLKTEFEFEDYDVLTADNGEDALKIFNEKRNKIHLIVLDWMIPNLDGLEVLRRIRKTSDVPIIMLTARDYVGDKVAGLNGGADDYVTKPFEIQELLARIRAAIRHRTMRSGSSDAIYRVRDLTLNMKTHQVFRNGESIQLTHREFQLLTTLFEHQGEVVPRQDLLDIIWGENFDGQPNIVDVYVRMVRDKIHDKDRSNRIIKTIRGVGYSLTDN